MSGLSLRALTKRAEKMGVDDARLNWAGEQGTKMQAICTGLTVHLPAACFDRNFCTDERRLSRIELCTFLSKSNDATISGREGYDPRPDPGGCCKGRRCDSSTENEIF